MPPAELRLVFESLGRSIKLPGEMLFGCFIYQGRYFLFFLGGVEPQKPAFEPFWATACILFRWMRIRFKADKSDSCGEFINHGFTHAEPK